MKVHSIFMALIELAIDILCMKITKISPHWELAFKLEILNYDEEKKWLFVELALLDTYRLA